MPTVCPIRNFLIGFLLAIARLPGCLTAEAKAETSDGTAQATGWTQWRGPQRNGLVAGLPDRLSQLRLSWSLPTASPGLGGLAATTELVVVVDHADVCDVYRCVEIGTGEVQWECRRPNETDIDFGPCPRITPLISDGRVFVLGAAGDLVCLDLVTGKVLWTRDFRHDFGTAELPMWGFCGSPLLVENRLVVNPGADRGSIVALDPATGTVLWSTPGRAANYSSLAAGLIQGVFQVIGYDKDGLGGWDAATGRPLWFLPVTSHKGYLVPTPQVVGERLLIAHTRGTELYEFSPNGVIIPEPIARDRQTRTELSTPLVLGDQVVVASGKLICLSLTTTLTRVWESEKYPRFRGNGIVHLVGMEDGSRILAFCYNGSAMLFTVSDQGLELVEERRLHDGGWSHPAILEKYIICRDTTHVHCYAITEQKKRRPAAWRN